MLANAENIDESFGLLESIRNHLQMGGEQRGREETTAGRRSFRERIGFKGLPIPSLAQVAAVVTLVLLAVYFATYSLRKQSGELRTQLDHPQKSNEELSKQNATARDLQSLSDSRLRPGAGRPPGENGADKYDLQPRPRAGTVLALRDQGGLVTLNDQGRLGGFGELSKSWQRLVTSALREGAVRSPVTPTALRGRFSVLLGSSGDDVPAKIIGPLDTVVESDRPLFRWRAERDAASYTVAIFDLQFNTVAQSGPLSTTEWKPPAPLQRGNTYKWQLTLMCGSKEVVLPAPPAPEATFKVLERSKADELKRAREMNPDSHLLMGVLYARAGLIDEAEQELRALVEANPKSRTALRLLRSVQKRQQLRP